MARDYSRGRQGANIKTRLADRLATAATTKRAETAAAVHHQQRGRRFRFLPDRLAARSAASSDHLCTGPEELGRRSQSQCICKESLDVD